MKYFTKELWLGYNSRSDAEVRSAIELGEQNRQEYTRQLQQLQSRLSGKAYEFFTTETLHDGRLLSYCVGDALRHDVHGAEKFDINRHHVAVEMRILGPHLDILYALGYARVRRTAFDYPTDAPLFHHEGGHIGDWGYDELTAVDDEYLRHEVLFASGTTILIEFKEFSWEKEPCDGRSI